MFAILAILAALDPNPADIARFPPLAVARQQMEYGERHRAWLNEDAQDGLPDVGEWRGEAWNCWDVWDDLRRAWEANSFAGRCGHLRDLRRKLERAGGDYAAGVMPPAVPVWRFGRSPWR